MKAPQTGHDVRAPLTRDRVLQAAIRLADNAGLAQLSMRKVARELGVEAMSLYHHVSSKEGLLDAMVDAVIAEIALPATEGDWKQAMRSRALSARGVLLRHPWAALLVISRVNVGPAMLGYIEAMLACLRRAGFSYSMADHAWNAIDNHVYGFVLQELSFPIAPGKYAEAARAFLPMLPVERYPHMRALAGQVIDGSHSGLNDFSFGLDIILDGLERLLPGN